MTDTPVMTTSEVADELGTDPKTLRKFFRSDKCDITPVGQGKRYAITADDIDDLKTSFGLWAGGKAKKADEGDDAEPKPDKAPAKAKKTKKGKKAAPAPVVVDDPDEDLDFGDDEPTADALAELEEDLDLGDDD